VHFLPSVPCPGLLEEALGGWWFPPQFFEQDVLSQHEEWSMVRFSCPLRGAMFHHKLTATCLGGPFSVKWATLALLRAHWCFQQLCSGRLPPRVPEVTVNVAAEADVVLQDLNWLCSKIETSIRMLEHACLCRNDRVWTTVLVDMPQFQCCDTLREPSPSVSPLYTYQSCRGTYCLQDTSSTSEPHLRGILKPSRSAPCNVRQQVVIEVLTIGMLSVLSWTN
jgi:hypothetical protein